MNDTVPASRGAPDAALRRARMGVALLFFINGAAFASWVSRIPALRAGLGLSDGTLGSVLFAMSCGVLLSFPFAGKGAQLLGARQLALLGGVVLLLMLPVPFVIGIVPSLVLVMLELGAMMGAMQVSMNVLAVDLQARTPRRIVSSLHGAWSAGGLVGAGLGGLAAHAGLPPFSHLCAAALVLGALLVGAWLLLRVELPPRLLPATAPATPSASHAPRRGRTDRVLVGLGLVCFCAFLTEGALADWSAVWLHERAGAPESMAALGYAVFAGAMTAMRLVGDRVLEAVGSTRLLRACSVLGSLALAGALVLARVDAAFVALVVLGLALATIVPSAYAAAGRHVAARAGAAEAEVLSARAIALLSGFGYGGLLAGPPVIGWLAQATSLSWALGLLVLLVATIAVLVPLLDDRTARRAAHRPGPAPAA
jgi:predicted MFS family arabinose efflux permease